MSTPTRPFWLPPLSIVVLAVLVGLLSFSPWRFIPAALTVPLALLLMLLRAYCVWPPMIRWVSTLPRVHRVVFAVLIAAMILGHYTFSNRACFPFMAWQIFPAVREEDPVTCREMIGTTATGEKVRLLIEQLFPSIVQIDPLDIYSPAATGRLVQAAARVYNERHVADPVRQVDLVVMAVQLHPPANESRNAPSCQLIKRYEISPGR